jgi:hypothetical protein
MYAVKKYYTGILVFLRSVHRLLVTANVVPSSLILVTLMMEALHSSEMSVLQEPHGATSQEMAFIIETASSDYTPQGYVSVAAKKQQLIIVHVII